MFRRRKFGALMLLCLSGMAMHLRAQEFAPEVESEGRIDRLDFGRATAQISGYDYTVSPTVEVEINNTYGAFTLLELGMLIQFNYLQFDNGQRQIIAIREVDTIEEH